LVNFSELVTSLQRALPKDNLGNESYSILGAIVKVVDDVHDKRLVASSLVDKPQNPVCVLVVQKLFVGFKKVAKDRHLGFLLLHVLSCQV
jgi:hypothetical protein